MKHKHNAGQTVVILMVFMVIASTITAAAVALSIINSQSASRIEFGESALSVANSGGENAILRLLRNPAYTGETMSVGNGTATVTITGSGPYVITSKGQAGAFTRTVQIVASGSGFLTVSSWKEIPY